MLGTYNAKFQVLMSTGSAIHWAAISTSLHYKFKYGREWLRELGREGAGRHPIKT